MSSQNKIALLVIDAQNDFSENREQRGSLYVAGAVDDFKRASQFIVNNLADISEVFATYDTHSEKQIFHPDWWIYGTGKKAGQQLDPFTTITSKEISEGIYKPIFLYNWSVNYVRKIEEKGGTHVIWPHHCINGTWGHQMQKDINSALGIWSTVNKKPINPVYKGYDPKTEFYGIFEAEVPVSKPTSFNNDLVGQLNEFDRVIVFGQAMSHCVGLSIKQLLNQAIAGNEKAGNLLSKMTLLSDCCSYIDGFEGNMEQTFKTAENHYGFTLKNHDQVDLTKPIAVG